MKKREKGWFVERTDITLKHSLQEKHLVTKAVGRSASVRKKTNGEPVGSSYCALLNKNEDLQGEACFRS